jgi:hypothetical protein
MRRILSFGLRGFVLLVVTASASAQATSTATRRITPSVFGGVTGVYTGLDSGRNLSVTAGVDVAFRPASRFHPAIEYRGMFAVGKGGTDSVKNNLGGVKVFARYGRFSPYADLLAGRGETTYANGGDQVPNTLIFYTQSASNVYSVGGGTDVFVGDHLAVKLDLQMQRYSSPVTISGHVYSETGTLGVVYVFHFGRKIY